MDDGASGEDLITPETRGCSCPSGTYRGTHVIAGAEIVWYAIDNAG
jgi:hypothetical protein